MWLALGAGFWGEPLDAPYTPNSVRKQTQNNFFYTGQWSWDVALPSPSLLRLGFAFSGSVGKRFGQAGRGNSAEYLSPQVTAIPGQSTVLIDGTPSDWALAYQMSYAIPFFGTRNLFLGGLGLQSLFVQFGFFGRSYISKARQYYGYTAQRLDAVVLLGARIRIGSLFVPSIRIGLRYGFYDQTRPKNPGWQADPAQLSFVFSIGTQLPDPAARQGL